MYRIENEFNDYILDIKVQKHGIVLVIRNPDRSIKDRVGLTAEGVVYILNDFVWSELSESEYTGSEGLYNYITNNSLLSTNWSDESKTALISLFTDLSKGVTTTLNDGETYVLTKGKFGTF
jgi:hypothetical protein